jgi:hypothetical protein
MRGASHTAPRLVFGLLASALTLEAACEPRIDPTRVLRREYIVGVQDALDGDPDTSSRLDRYEQVVDLPTVVTVDRRSPPPPCGIRVGTAFVKETSERFGVSPLHACSNQDTSVYCATTYLPAPYDRLFFEVSYSYVAGQKMKISVDVMRRDRTGGASPSAATLGAEDRIWFNRFATSLHLTSLCQST